MSARRFALLALILFVGLWGCSRRSPDEVGVIARVNNRPITLDLLEFQYDLQHFEAVSGSLPSVSSLREAYGQILGQLIAQELVAQELAKRGQEISDEELAKAEAEIRADYPGDTFEKMLADEYIDLKMWRKNLRYVCGIEKFQRLVLRPAIHLDYREVEAYYQSHLAAFRLPERVRLLVVRSAERTQVEKVLAAYRQEKDTAVLAKNFPGAQVREVTVARDLLIPTWSDALHGADADGRGVVLASRVGFDGVLLLERLPAQTVDITKAYPQVESALLEERLQQTFDGWLNKAVDGSVIRVSTRLLHKKADEDLPPEPQSEDKEQQDVASGNETG
ncbi:MAG: peptidylprolyl isomerase [Humidesulfovibrio sp.]|nr:peptidylprolyl isomerase [Humidesulfovibrio sp.]